MVIPWAARVEDVGDVGGIDAAGPRPVRRRSSTRRIAASISPSSAGRADHRDDASSRPVVQHSADVLGASHALTHPNGTQPLSAMSANVTAASPLSSGACSRSTHTQPRSDRASTRPATVSVDCASRHILTILAVTPARWFRAACRCLSTVNGKLLTRCTVKPTVDATARPRLGNPCLLREEW